MLAYLLCRAVVVSSGGTAVAIFVKLSPLWEISAMLLLLASLFMKYLARRLSFGGPGSARFIFGERGSVDDGED